MNKEEINKDNEDDNGNFTNNVQIENQNNEDNEEADIQNNNDWTINNGNKEEKKKNRKEKRKKLSKSDALKIWQAYNKNGVRFAKEFTFSLGYHKTTFYKVIENQGKIMTKWTHPNHKNKWDDLQIETAIKWIEENPVLTLGEIIDKGIQNNFPEITASTLSSYLNGQLVTLKKVRIDPIARNSDETKRQRIEYCSNFMDNLKMSFIFIDEMGMSVCTLRNRGRSKRGTRAILTAPLSKAPNISVCMAVNKDIGLVHYETQNEAYDAEDFYGFIKNLIEKCKEKKLKNICFVMDNAKIHKKDDNKLKNLCLKKHINLWFLPPYSPELNPIENVFSMVKNNIRKKLATTYRQELMETTNLPWGEKGKKRIELLLNILNEVSNVITPDLMEEYWDHLMKVIPKVFKNQNI